MSDAARPALAAPQQTVIEAYEAGVARGAWQLDPSQREVCNALARLERELEARATPDWLTRLGWARPRAARGIYLHGGVGRGKTFLVDLLHDSLAPELRLRLHFHRFMGRVHAELGKLRHTSDPLKLVAERFAERPLLCLDEFFVQDIADAMILAELLKHLVRFGGTLVTTSNIPPRELYKDGLQRAKFLPAIAFIERHCEVLHLQSPTDYRLRALTSAPVYHAPAGAAAEAALEAVFARIAPGSLRPEPEMVVNDRPIALKKRADGVAWFEFAALCEGPRAVADYIELAQSYNTVLISNVPRFAAQSDDAGRRFVHLVDEFYDRNVNLIVSAAVPIVELYAGERLRLEFERLQSRLIEMQSAEYLARPHKP
jgi:cell division protein ZapE